MPQWRAFVVFVLGWSNSALAGELAVELRDLKGAPLADAIVFAEPASGTAPKPAAPLRATIDQINTQFVPRVSVMRAGTEVSFPNSDNIRHSVYSFSPAKVFTTKLYAGKQAAPVLFDKTGVIVLGCNIHDNMLAWAVIVDTPWYGKSAADGVVTLKNLPAGSYKLNSWYPGFTQPQTEQLEVASQGTTRHTVRIDSSVSPLKAGA